VSCNGYRIEEEEEGFEWGKKYRCCCWVAVMLVVLLLLGLLGLDDVRLRKLGLR
jgi:hypothetical protein